MPENLVHSTGRTPIQVASKCAPGRIATEELLVSGRVDSPWMGLHNGPWRPESRSGPHIPERQK